MLIRNATPADYDAIRALMEDAFDRSAEAMLVEALRRDNDAIIDIVADNVGPTVGHAMFSRMAAPFRALGLGPIAVVANARGHGVAAKLIRHGLEEAARSGYRGVFVLGDPAFYGRFGFEADLARGFTSLYAGAHFMVAPLGRNLPARVGNVAYAPAFAALE